MATAYADRDTDDVSDYSDGDSDSTNESVYSYHGLTIDTVATVATVAAAAAGSQLEDVVDQYHHVRKYFEQNYKAVIPKDCEIDYECLDEDDVDSDTLDSWDDRKWWDYFSDEIADMATDVSVNSWCGSKYYKMTFHIIWRINDLDPVTTDCKGWKCRRTKSLSFSDWCTACHGEPRDVETKQLVKIYMVDDSDEKITFRKIRKHIVSVVVSSIEEIIDSDKKKRAHDVAAIIASKEAQIVELRIKLVEEEEKFRQIYHNLGFDSATELDFFLSKEK